MWARRIRSRKLRGGVTVGGMDWAEGHGTCGTRVDGRERAREWRAPAGVGGHGGRLEAGIYRGRGPIECVESAKGVVDVHFNRVLQHLVIQNEIKSSRSNATKLAHQDVFTDTQKVVWHGEMRSFH